MRQLLGEKQAIDCSAPVFFFDTELPSGRIYDEEVAKHVCDLINDKNIPVMFMVGDAQREIGSCYHAVIQERAVLARMVLSPKYKYLEEKWNMIDMYFYPALEMKKLPAPKTHYGLEEFVSLSHFLAETI